MTSDLLDAADRPVITGAIRAFDLDESALPIGAACMASIALEFLERP
jgi:hypothetical protein